MKLYPHNETLPIYEFHCDFYAKQKRLSNAEEAEHSRATMKLYKYERSPKSLIIQGILAKR